MPPSSTASASPEPLTSQPAAAAVASLPVSPGARSSAPIRLASYVMAGLLCLGILVFGLLPGLLAVCFGFVLTRSLAGERRRRGLRMSPAIAATIVIFLPLIGLGLLLSNARGMAFGVLGQYQALLHLLAGTVLEIREKLPADLALHLPVGLGEAQVWLANYLKSQARALTGFGTAGLRGLLFVYVGLAIGALMHATAKSAAPAPLRLEISRRAANFLGAFRQIMVAQFWIASINATATAVFLMAVLPLFGVQMPYIGALVALTFIAGLIPIVGNLLCNIVITLAGVSISAEVGLACLVFLIVIHKTEYAVNAKILGNQTNTAAWELLSVMFMGEAVFGLPGLVAAPLFYAFAKKELYDARLI